ncbi:MAG: transglycosylase SLT domain-containing protein [Halobacteriovoraceae bacterium]|nr:transglycosylase SLT domain-containing protein [Halobacteriovoraceae bacterium]MCB9095967.1 transglycosylase SLT domain-containing protein [Halobacteriovoraceae bacterium]
MNLLVIFIFLIQGCSLVQKSSQTEEVEQVQLSEQIHQDEEAYYKKKETAGIIAKLPECEGCIVGSDHGKAENYGEIPYYKIENGEELNLKNQFFSIPVTYNRYTEKWVNYFLTRGRSWFIKYAERAGRYAPILSDILAENGLPRDLIYLAMAESGFQNEARSWASAVGPWQFIKGTGKKYGLEIDWYIDERRDPIKATLAASRYLKDLYGLFQSWELAAAAYNAGEGKVMRATRRYRSQDFWRLRRGRYLRSETKNYVPKIMALAILGKNLEVFGFDKEINFQQPLEYEVVHVDKGSDLYLLADSLGMPFEEIQRWNPELMRWVTPPKRPYYPVRVPVGKRAAYNECCSQKEFIAKDNYQKYTVRSVASVNVISQKFKVPKEVIANLNEVPVNQTFKKGEEVHLPFREGQSRTHKMYADLYRRKRYGRGRRGTSMSKRIQIAKRYGTKIDNPTQFYKVRKGDTLWAVSKKTGVSINTLIKSNLGKIKDGYIHPGVVLAIK